MAAKRGPLPDPPRSSPAAPRPTGDALDSPGRGSPVELGDVCFHASFVCALPGDAGGRAVPREVREAAYSLVNPTPVAAPRLLAWSDDLGTALGILRPVSLDGPAAQVLAGNRVLPGMQPYAARYGGHQFGVWARQLGDGRAITLGEIVTGAGDRFDLQLKGAGPTPYSRRGDGRAVLRSSLREFVCSEAMHHLGVPTTRALSLVATGDAVVRDVMYDGHAKAEPGAIVCRVAPSFVRFGNFEILAAQGEPGLLKSLLDYVIRTHCPTLGETGPPVYARWFEDVCRSTAVMVAHWMRVGFVHGVMNTDNMSVHGLTIDYGPYGWIEGFDPMWTPNTTDAAGRRYCFGQQPQVALWNLARLAESLLSLVERDALEAGLAAYGTAFDDAHRQMFSRKLGLDDLRDAEDETLLADLLALLGAVETDYTIFFRRLAVVPVDDHDADLDAAACLHALDDAFYSDDGRQPEHQGRVLEWLRRYGHCLRKQGIAGSARKERMRGANPKYVPRNYLAQLAIDAAEQGDTSVLERLLRVVRRPYDDQPEAEDLAARRPEWARHRVGCSALSCSS